MVTAVCPEHSIPDCSPLLNGCSWQPTTPTDEQVTATRAVLTARVKAGRGKQRHTKRHIADEGHRLERESLGLALLDKHDGCVCDDIGVIVTAILGGRR